MSKEPRNSLSQESSAVFATVGVLFHELINRFRDMSHIATLLNESYAQGMGDSKKFGELLIMLNEATVQAQKLLASYFQFETDDSKKIDSVNVNAAIQDSLKLVSVGHSIPIYCLSLDLMPA